MPYARQKCRECGRKATAKRWISGRGLCKSCAIERSREAVEITYELSQALEALPTRSEDGTLEAGIERSISYMIARRNAKEGKT